jgi:hypothetical protein
MSRFDISPRFDGKWAITDSEAKTGGILVICPSKEQAEGMLELLQKEIPSSDPRPRKSRRPDV